MGSVSKLNLVFNNFPHNRYYLYVPDVSHYTDISNDNFYYFFSPADEWNDINDIESTKKKENRKDYIYLYRCLSYFKSESIAMWKMYAENGGCFKLSKAPINNFKNIISHVELVFENKHSEPLEKKCCEPFSATDVIYYEQNSKNKFTVLRSTHKEKVNKKTFDSNTSNRYIKNIGWSYECECRLCIRIHKKYIRKNAKLIGAKVFLKNNKKYTKTYIPSPLAEKQKTIILKNIKVEESVFQNMVCFKEHK